MKNSLARGTALASYWSGTSTMRFLIFIALFAVAVTNAATSVRPNIIIYLSDDHGRIDCGVYGNKVVRTPNLYGLAKESLSFMRAFAASPTCTPSRSAMFTGLFPMRNGAHPNHAKIKEGIKTWPSYFHELGYRVVLAGKTHISPKPAFPFEYLPSKVDPKAPPLHEELDTKQIDALLADHAGDRKEPLCLIVADWNPHYTWAENDGYDPAKIQLPPYLVDTEITRRIAAQYYTDVSLMDKALGETLASMDRHGFKDALLIYASDNGAFWPHAKWNVYDAGINVPFLARWPGKIKPGRTDSMISLIDLLPTMIEVAEGKRPKEIDGKSFLPVLLGKQHKHRDLVFAAHTSDTIFRRGGTNIVLEYPMRAVRTQTHKYILNIHPDRKFRTHETESDSTTGRSMWASWVAKAQTNSHAAKLIRNFQHRPAEELYDLTNDPDELNNIADQPKNHKLVKSLRRNVLAWMEQQQDEELKAVPHLNLK